MTITDRPNGLLQQELLPVTPAELLTEYRAAFRNDSVHMPEVSLRYLIYLVLSETNSDEARAFALQVRTDLNEQRLARFIASHLAPPTLTNHTSAQLEKLAKKNSEQIARGKAG